MKYEKFNEVRNAARAFALVSETGSRNADKKAEELVAEWVRKNCRERKTSSRHIVYLRGYNYGTKKYSDYAKVVETSSFKPNTIKETEKSFVITTDYDKIIVSKAFVLGWLS